MWTDVFPGNMLLFFFFSAVQKVCELFCHGQVFSRSKKCFSTALHPDEALPVFTLFHSTTCGPSAPPSPLSWPPDRYTKQTRGGPSWQQLWARALQDHIMNHHELPLGSRLQRPVWWRPGEAIDQPLTHEELAHTKTPRAATAAPATPAAALVEDEPSGSGSKRRKVQVDPIARDWFLDMLGRWRRERRWDTQRCLCEVQRLCTGMFDGTNPNTLYRWKRSTARAETRGRRSMLTPADTTRLGEHIMKVTDVLCLSAVTIRGLMHEWLDAEGLDARPGEWWVRQLLHGMRLSFKKPAKCLKELHSPALQEANTHRLFIKLCWLMDKHTVSADRVVNIDETSCRLLPVHQTGWGRRGVKQAQLQGNTREATTFTVAFSMVHGPLDMLVQIVHAGKTDAVLPEQPWPERTHHVTSENGWATTTTLLQLAASLDNVLNPGREGQSWILLWDMASIHASEATLAAMRAAFPHIVLPHSTSYLQPCDVAVFRSFKSCIQAQASTTLARSVLDGSFEGLAMNKAWRRQSSAEWASRAATDLCEKNQVWTTGWHRLRAGTNAEFRDAVTEAAALHAHDELFSKHIEPEPAPEDPVDWAMAEAQASDDEDDAPMPNAPPELELIDMPPAPASAPRMSNLERCIALRLVYGAGPGSVETKMHNHHQITSSLCCLSCAVCRVSCLSVVVSVGVQPRHPDTDKPFFFCDGLKKSVDTR